jgi:hypothetical protein
VDDSVSQKHCPSICSSELKILSSNKLRGLLSVKHEVVRVQRNSRLCKRIIEKDERLEVTVLLCFVPVFI